MLLARWTHKVVRGQPSSSLSLILDRLLRTMGIKSNAIRARFLPAMSDQFFERPILNSPYDYPARHWELDETGQPTQLIADSRRPAQFITPIPKPKKQKGGLQQEQMVFDEGKGLSTEAQAYDTTSNINELRRRVDLWRAIPNPAGWRGTPETARLLEHWRHHAFNSIRPFFCQVEAVETAIWLTEVAPNESAGKSFLEVWRCGIIQNACSIRNCPA